VLPGDAAGDIAQKRPERRLIKLAAFRGFFVPKIRSFVRSGGRSKLSLSSLSHCHAGENALIHFGNLVSIGYKREIITLPIYKEYSDSDVL
jgi:hypothetical protein